MAVIFIYNFSFFLKCIIKLFQTYVETDVPKEPDLKIQMCLDIKVYAKHKPPLDCAVTDKCVEGIIDNQQVDVQLTSTADTAAQVNVLGTDHLEGFGLEVKHLLRTKLEKRKCL
jgi:hypothetical protein